jgi:hypothetical protein
VKNLIYELADKAIEEKLTLDQFIQYIQQNPNDYYGFNSQELKKFVELIIDECLNVISKDIKKYFDLDTTI